MFAAWMPFLKELLAKCLITATGIAVIFGLAYAICWLLDWLDRNGYMW